MPIPEFLSAAEKEKLKILPNFKIQSLGRDASGQVTVYKVIKTDSDIILDPSKITPINPPPVLPVK